MIACLAAAALFAQTGGLGRIDFPASGSPAAYRRFIEGVLLLHSFEYDDARDEFRAAQKLDPNFAMAYWGEAMTYNEPIWFFHDGAGGRAALGRLGSTREERLAKAIAPREKGYIAAVDTLFFGPVDPKARDLAYAAAMKRLHDDNPQDLEAAAFYALALLGASHGGRDFRIYMRAAAIADEVLQRNPRHPGALHYLIHSYDDPVHAPLGLRAARAYAEVAPRAAHALHMPSHIFIALGMWDEYVKSNESSWAASEARVSRKSLGVEHRGYHALWWLQYGYLQQGRLRDAQRLLDTVAEDAARSEARIVRSHWAQMYAHHIIETGQESGTPPAGGDLDSTAAASTLFAQAYLAIGRHDRVETQRLAAKLGDLETEQQGASPHESHHVPDMQAIAIMRKQLEGLLLLDGGSTEQAIERLKESVAMEDRMTLEFGPPMPPKPSHELFGEVLLALGHALQAQAQFELALERSPKRALSLLGLARSAAKSGDRDTSKSAYAELRQIRRRAD